MIRTTATSYENSSSQFSTSHYLHSTIITGQTGGVWDWSPRPLVPTGSAAAVPLYAPYLFVVKNNKKLPKLPLYTWVERSRVFSLCAHCPVVFVRTMRSSTRPVESIVGKILLNRMWSTDLEAFSGWARILSNAQSYTFFLVWFWLRSFISFTFLTSETRISWRHTKYSN